MKKPTLEDRRFSSPAVVVKSSLDASILKSLTSSFIVSYAASTFGTFSIFKVTACSILSFNCSPNFKLRDADDDVVTVLFGTSFISLGIDSKLSTFLHNNDDKSRTE